MRTSTEIRSVVSMKLILRWWKSWMIRCERCRRIITRFMRSMRCCSVIKKKIRVLLIENCRSLERLRKSYRKRLRRWSLRGIDEWWIILQLLKKKKNKTNKNYMRWRQKHESLNKNEMHSFLNLKKKRQNIS